jgi:hypothetical protein
MTSELKRRTEAVVTSKGTAEGIRQTAKGY